jgi:hypothetical protein
MGQDPRKVADLYDAVAKEYADTFSGDHRKKPKDREILHRFAQEIRHDFMFFRTDFICRCLEDSGFERIEVIDRDPYPGVDYQSRRAYVFARKPIE